METVIHFEKKNDDQEKKIIEKKNDQKLERNKEYAENSGNLEQIIKVHLKQMEDKF